MKKRSSLRQSLGVSLCLTAALFLLPLAVVKPFSPQRREEPRPLEQTPEGVPFVSGAQDAAVTLRVLDGDAVTEMDLGTYLLGVVRAEMPASFQLEALKAQAVAARTYTLYQMASGGNHGAAADVCTDSTCCQAYLHARQAESNWGEQAAIYEGKVAQAVQETDGQAIYYQGAPILAVFHAASAGLTRPAGAVWQADLPYLTAVDSPEKGEQIPNYYSRAAFTGETFRKKVLASCPEAVFSGGMETWLTDAVTDAAGSVETVKVGGVTLKGSTLRGILGLRSACFEWEVQDGELVFYVTGYGHGVGLSQYGANAMAESGADYREILTHYYTGTEIASLSPA